MRMRKDYTIIRRGAGTYAIMETKWDGWKGKIKWVETSDGFFAGQTLITVGCFGRCIVILTGDSGLDPPSEKE